MQILQLEKLKNLFKDDASYKLFVNHIKNSVIDADEDMVVLLDDEDVVGGIFSSQTASNQIAQGIVDRLTEKFLQPSMLNPFPV